MTTLLQKKIAAFPRAPGVYLMTDARGVVLYVGKALNLRARVRSYFRKDADTRYQIRFLLRALHDIDIVVTDTEKEALLLERTLIRKHQPRYNIFFRDDKNYVSVRVTMQHPFPGVYRTRKVRKDKARYFGPYTSGAACRETIDLVTRYFRLRTCTDTDFANRARPCIQYQIGRCTAPCVGLVTREAYQSQVDAALLLLHGKKNELTEHLTTHMHQASAQERFEEAARLRDLLGDIATTVEPQKMIRQGEAPVDCDYLGWAAEGTRGGVVMLQVRGGKVVGQQGAVVRLGADEPSAFIESFATQYYQPPRVPPSVLCLPCDPASVGALADFLSERRGAPVKLVWPQRGAHAKLLRLAVVNARARCRAETSAEERWDELCVEAQHALQLPTPPHVVECVDISNWSGTAAVGALVAFAGGEPAKARYRHYRIRGPQQPNDYAMMHEVLTRRLAKRTAWPLPDLLLVDGGRGQLGIALRVLQEAGVDNLPCAGIAKPHAGEDTDKIYIPGRKNPVSLRRNHPVLLFLQRVRDEAHRFAVTYQRKVRGQKAVR